MRHPSFLSIGGDGGTDVSYTTGFKARMIERITGSEGISANALSKETGISQPTLSRWVRDGSLGEMNKKKAKKRRAWTATEKFRVVQQASQLSENELGEFLRREGLHASQLIEWTELVQTAALTKLAPQKRSKSKLSPEEKTIKGLEKELSRKEKALAEVTAILVLKKRIQAIWGDEGDDTTPRTEA